MELILATRNQGKIRELERMFRALAFDVRILGLDDFPEVGSLSEPGRTFFENALHKASTVCRLTGQPALADDSGLEVDALAGAPGVYSARYSKEGASDVENNRKLLQDLANTPREHRTARFRCQLVACLPGGETLSAEGTWEGWIGFESKGDNGFGYDPLFIDRQTGLTAAQMPAEEKNSKSHRAKALKRFVRAWPEFVRKLEKGKDL
ncbi:MAG: RdgB/HAM1 family non-canonical purine NTP pyrophosphatase [Desulfohalobiaceae bacterium]|nr:RdgB/HAM1 family non-canonical purine NTP pyrophosphatase [Desulfohalobiaceae bacterium]